ncbi:MAG: hypothetical protein K6E18_08430 [Lachnospiraceae bacterium]|nr:hypothetical protein [Lachnospiraceae bacterium]
MSNRRRKKQRKDNITNIGDFQRKGFSLKFNIGTVVLLFLLGYMIIQVVAFFSSKHIVSYEVVRGSLSVSNIYEGIAIRQEESYPCTGAGYLNFFAREGEHVAAGDLVYSIDSSGKIGEMIRSQSEDVLLSDTDLSEIRDMAIRFQKEFSETRFESLYPFYSQVTSNALKLSNYNMLDQLQMISGGDSSNFVYAPKSGTVVFGSDGLENLRPEDVTMALFEEKAQRTVPTSGELVSSSDAAYKLIDSEKWSIVIPMDLERAAQLEEKEYVNVRFLKNRYEAWAKVTLLLNEDGSYVQLDFTNSCITFAQERYLSVEILLGQEEGLKVPNSAIQEKKLFLIPCAYKMDSKNSKDGGFLVEVFDTEEGKKRTVFRDCKIYNSDDVYYYVDSEEFTAGERIILPEGADTYGLTGQNEDGSYTVGVMETVNGVYNMNKGYADFTMISILYQNDEYSIVKSNTQYGLSEYDYIVLDAESVKPDQFLYE